MTAPYKENITTLLYLFENCIGETRFNQFPKSAPIYHEEKQVFCRRILSYKNLSVETVISNKTNNSFGISVRIGVHGWRVVKTYAEIQVFHKNFTEAHKSLSDIPSLPSPISELVTSTSLVLQQRRTAILTFIQYLFVNKTLWTEPITKNFIKDTQQKHLDRGWVSLDG